MRKKKKWKEESLEKESKKKKRGDMQDRLDTLQAMNDQLKLENAELKAARSDSVINEKVKIRMGLLTKASKVINTDSLIDKSDREIMETVIIAKEKNIDLKAKIGCLY